MRNSPTSSRDDKDETTLKKKNSLHLEPKSVCGKDVHSSTNILRKQHYSTRKNKEHC